MTNPVVFRSEQIAPCGINCGTCIAHLRAKNKCLGCREHFAGKRKTCLECRIKNCEKLQVKSFCWECPVFPCDRIKHIDKRYKSKYRASLIDNLLMIRDSGIKSFLQEESCRWICTRCGNITSIHSYQCLHCGMQLGNRPL